MKALFKLLPQKALWIAAIWLTGSTLCATTQTHPVELAPDTDSSTCVECHASLQEGKYVHTAMSMGCLTCHAIKRDGGITTVTLVAPANQLCFTCHQKSSDPVQHQPYSEGMCVACHSPHSSNFPAHTLVAEQELCMGCHVRGLPKVNTKKKTVAVPWGVTLTFQQMKGWYYIGLNQAHTANHPVMKHPVTGPNTALGKSAPDITCLSCHRTHASTQSNLRPPQFPNQMALCVSCHTSL
jgi:predicted CXXCH cytochrome family protein